MPDERGSVAGLLSRRLEEPRAAGRDLPAREVEALLEGGVEVQLAPAPVGLPAGLRAHGRCGRDPSLTRGVDQYRLDDLRIPDRGASEQDRPTRDLRRRVAGAGVVLPELTGGLVIGVRETAIAHGDEIRLLAPADGRATAGPREDRVVARVGRPAAGESADADDVVGDRRI